MSKQTDQKYWFKAKRYGWGWGVPQNIQGWIAFGIFAVVWLWALGLFILPPTEGEVSTTKPLIGVAIILADVLALLYVSFKYGEAPKWRWGNKRGKRTKTIESKSD